MMTKTDKFASLVDRFPNLFRNVKSASSPVRLRRFTFGIECGDGWFPLIEELCSKIEEVIVSLPDEERRGTYALQIKEKFGELRFYMSACNEKIDALIDEATSLSLKTCERCGELGKIRTDGWYRTLCDHHEKEWSERRSARGTYTVVK